MRPASEAYLFGVTPPHPAIAGIAFGSALAHVAIGYGLILGNKLAYYSLKAVLCVLLAGFPVGTALGHQGLRYMRRPEVRRYFGFAR
jgi:hypothetical protein